MTCGSAVPKRRGDSRPANRRGSACTRAQIHFMPKAVRFRSGVPNAGKAIIDLVPVLDEFLSARDLTDVWNVIHKSVQHLTGADTATFNLRKEILHDHANARTINLLKAKGFPIDSYITKQVINRPEPVIIDDIQSDEQVPSAIRRSSPFRSLIMVPVRQDHPIGTIGAYWSEHFSQLSEMVGALQFLGELASFAVGQIERQHDRELKARIIRDSEKRYQVIGEILPYGVWWADRDGRPEYVSPTFLSLLDMSMEEVRAYGWSRRIVQEDAEAATRKWLNCVQTGTPWDHIFRISDGEGRIRTVLSRGLPVMDEKGRISSWTGINLDITAFVQSEEALRISEERLRLALESADLGTWDYDLTTGKINWSDRCRELLGVSPGVPADYATFLNRLHPDDRERVNSLVLAAADPTGDGSYEAEYRLQLPDGTERWVMARGRVVFDTVDGQRRAVRFIGTGLEVTSRKLMEEALRTARDTLDSRVRERTAELRKSNRALKEYAARLEKLNAELQEFAFVASHDLQEPLRKIQTFGDMLSSKCEDKLNPEGRDYLRRITKSAKRMSDLIKSLLDYSQIANKLNPFEPTNLAESVRNALSELEPIIQQKSARVEIGMLPVIDADPLQIRLLFQNLLHNAVKFHKPLEAPFIKVHSLVQGKRCRIFVRDEGIGFDREYADRIFRPFQQLHGKTAPYGGTGMGLAICRKIVDRHGGKIAAESQPGGGSTFIIELPLRQTGRGREKAV